MAKTKTIDEAVDELMKDYKKAIKTAAKYATDKIAEDIYKHSLEVLQKYYDSYPVNSSEPTSYERTYRLQNSFIPLSIMRSKGDDIVCSMGVVYDHNRLNGYYNGSKSYQPVDGWWVVDNYLDGIHPTTNGSPIPKDFIGPLFDGQERAEYIPIKDKYSPTYRMEGYLEICKKRFSNYMMISLMNQLLRK